MSLALLAFKLQLTSHSDGGHFGFCQYGGPHQKPKQFDIADLSAKFGAFGRI